MDIKIHAIINKAYSYALWGYRYESLEINYDNILKKAKVIEKIFQKEIFTLKS